MSFPHPIRSLAQLPDLSGLADVCREFDVEITAFGSLVRRLARVLVDLTPESDQPLPDLFQLAPFLSDIDLRHSGPPEKTLQIRRAILNAVPFSECFRWEIFSEEELKPFTADEVHLSVIPANKLRLSTRSGRGIEDPFDGYKDLHTRSYRLLRSPYGHRSMLYREFRDHEFLRVLHYLRVLFEEPQLADKQPGWEAAQQIARESQTPALLGALEESAALRARFRYRSQAMRASCRSNALWEKYTGDNGIGQAIDYINRLPFPVLDLGERESGNDRIKPADALASSCRLIGDQSRLRFLVRAALQDSAEKEWEEIRAARQPLGTLGPHSLPALPEGQKVVADTPEFRITLGRAPSALGDEHLHFQIPLTAACAAICQNYGEARLGAFMLFSREGPSSYEEQPVLESFAVPLPVVCHLVTDTGGTQTRLQIRANCGSMLETFPELIWEEQPNKPSWYRLKLFVVAQT